MNRLSYSETPPDRRSIGRAKGFGYSGSSLPKWPCRDLDTFPQQPESCFLSRKRRKPSSTSDTFVSMTCHSFVMPPGRFFEYPGLSRFVGNAMPISDIVDRTRCGLPKSLHFEPRTGI